MNESTNMDSIKNNQWWYKHKGRKVEFDENGFKTREDLFHLMN